MGGCILGAKECFFIGLVVYGNLKYSRDFGKWNSFVNILNHSAIALSEEEDQLKWIKNIGTGVTLSS